MSFSMSSLGEIMRKVLPCLVVVSFLWVGCGKSSGPNDVLSPERENVAETHGGHGPVDPAQIWANGGKMADDGMDAVKSDASSAKSVNADDEGIVWHEPLGASDASDEDDIFWTLDQWELPGDRLEGFRGEKMKMKVRRGGPSFEVVLEDLELATVRRVDLKNQESVAVRGMYHSEFCAGDGNCTILSEDFNFDGYRDLAFLKAFDDDKLVYALWLWNPETDQFNTLEMTSTSEIRMYPEHKAIVLATPAFVMPYGPVDCPAMFTFEGTKPVRHPFPMPRTRNNRPRYTVESSSMDAEKYPHLDSLVYEFLKDDDVVEGYVVSCAFPIRVLYIKDVELDGMQIKDVNGDGFADLIFRRKSNPSEFKTALWDRENNRFDRYE